MSTARPKKEVVIAIMGPTGAGKSSFFSLCGAPDFAAGHSLRSETREPREWTGEYKGVSLTLLDTPGFGDKDMTDATILEQIALWLQNHFEQGRKINGIIYLHRIIENRMTSIDVTNVKMFRSLCGKDAMANVILCTSFWDRIDGKQGAEMERQLCNEFWNGMIEMGATTARHNGTQKSALAILNRILRQNGVNLQIQMEMNEGKTMEETEAGQIAVEDLARMQKQFDEKLAKMQEEHKEALAERDVQMEKLIKLEAAKMRKEIRKLEEDKRRLEQDIQGLKDGLYRRPTSGPVGNFVRWLDDLINGSSPQAPNPTDQV